MATAVSCVLVSTCGRCRFIWIDACATESIFGRWAFGYSMQFYDVPMGLVCLWSAFGISNAVSSWTTSVGSASTTRIPRYSLILLLMRLALFISRNGTTGSCTQRRSRDATGGDIILAVSGSPNLHCA